MAHNIATINGKPAMAYQGETPWHQLGTRMDDGERNVARAMEASSLNWAVELQKLFLADQQEVPNRLAVVRTTDAKILSTVSGGYQVIQYADAFAAFQPACDEFGLTIECAGALGEGERAWMLFRLPTVVSPVPGDDVQGYGLAITGHDGRTIYAFVPTPIRVVCQNTLNAAIGNAEGRIGVKGRIFGIMHFGTTVDAQVKAASGLVSKAIAAMTETGETFATMARKRLTAEQTIAFIEKVFPPVASGPNKGTVTDAIAEKRSIVAELVFHGVGAELALRETDGAPNPWALYNAVTEYFDHVNPARSEKRGAAANVSAVFGPGNDVKQDALQAAIDLTQEEHNE